MARTLGDAVQKVLERVRKSTSSTAYKNAARDYICDMVAELLPLIPPQSLDRTTTFVTTDTMTVTGASATGFTSGETITGSSSGATATVDSYDDTNGYIYVYSVSGTFTTSDTVTGGDSGATATYSALAPTRVYTPISGPVTAWWGAVNVTQDWEMSIIGPDTYDGLDPDRDFANNAESLFVGGLDASTGYPTLEVWPADATTGDTIRLRYRIDIARWTSSDDSTTLQVLGLTRPLESVVIYGAASLYAEQERNFDLSRTEAGNAQRALEAVRVQARRSQGNRRYPPKTYEEESDATLTIRIGGDTVTEA